VAPTAKKPPGEFRETIKISSASAWDKVTIKLFHVVFNKTDYTELQGSNYIDKALIIGFCHTLFRLSRMPLIMQHFPPTISSQFKMKA
jgi:hypothetical protein